jgi:SAM-dependent methyltransferase
LIIDYVRGRLRAADRALQRTLQRRFERRLGLDTFRVAGLTELGLDRSDRVHYVASPATALPRVLKRLGDREYGAFADLGSGKGQALVIAARLPYRRVTGVELSAELNAIARRNLDRVQPTLRCHDFELVTGDALAWPIPCDLSVVYLYCPFIGDVFARVLERIFASYDACPRPLFVVYAYPWEHNWLVMTGRVATIDVNPAIWPTRPGWWENDHVIVTYQVVPPDGSCDATPLPRRGIGWRRAMEHWSRANGTGFEIHPPDGPPLYSRAG